MTTFVGTQKDFMDAVQKLIELDYDAVEAYGVAISKVVNASYRKKLSAFMADHCEHIDRLSDLVYIHGGEPPTGPSTLKPLLTKGKVYIASLISEKTVLQAMLDNEEDTTQAYTRMRKRSDQWPDAVSTLLKGAEDEMKHKQWLEKTIASYKSTTK